jgi:hypothetical protein
MTSITLQGRRAVTSEWFSQIVARQFAAVFGYERLSTLSQTQLSSVVDPDRAADEAGPHAD